MQESSVGACASAYKRAVTKYLQEAGGNRGGGRYPNERGGGRLTAVLGAMLATTVRIFGSLRVSGQIFGLDYVMANPRL